MTLTSYLYNGEGEDSAVDLSAVDMDANGSASTGSDQSRLLWIDAEAPSEADFRLLAKQLGWPADWRAIIDNLANTDFPQSFGDFLGFAVRTVGEPHNQPIQVGGDASPSISRYDLSLSQRVMFLFGTDWLLTVHDAPLGMLALFRSKDRATSLIGTLTPATLAASLLDWMLGDYFEEIGAMAVAIDALDERVLRDTATRTLLGRIVAVRHRISRVRMGLVASRAAFYGLVRPDFSVFEDKTSNSHFRLLANRFERALDEIERVRDLVNGSFDLFSSRSSLQTNTLMKALTVVTAVLGYIGATAGLFGVNFKAPLFDAGGAGFLALLGFLLLSVSAMLVFARMRRWL